MLVQSKIKCMVNASVWAKWVIVQTEDKKMSIARTDDQIIIVFLLVYTSYWCTSWNVFPFLGNKDTVIVTFPGHICLFWVLIISCPVLCPLYFVNHLARESAYYVFALMLAFCNILPRN